MKAFLNTLRFKLFQMLVPKEIKDNEVNQLLFSPNHLGTILIVFEKGGEGPEGIICHSFASVGQVPGVKEKLKKLADGWQ